MLKYPLLLQAQCYTYTVAFILLSSEVILLYSHCAKKGLVYVVIIALSSYQPSFYSECTSINMQSSYNVCLVSNTKYIFLYFIFVISQFLSRNT